MELTSPVVPLSALTEAAQFGFMAFLIFAVLLMDGIQAFNRWYAKRDQRIGNFGRSLGPEE